MRRLRVVLVLTGLMLTVTSTASASLEGALFRTPGEAAYCTWGLVGPPSQFVCWTPNDGFTVSMGLRGTPRKSYVRGNRGLVQNQARLLYFGRTWRGGSFVCRSRSTGLTCRNRRGHGWWLGRYVGYKIF